MNNALWKAFTLPSLMLRVQENKEQICLPAYLWPFGSLRSVEMLTHTAVVCALSITLLGNLGLQALSCESELFHEAYEFSRVESSFAGYVKALCRNWLGRRHPTTFF